MKMEERTRNESTRVFGPLKEERHVSSVHRHKAGRKAGPESHPLVLSLSPAFFLSRHFILSHRVSGQEKDKCKRCTE